MKYKMKEKIISQIIDDTEQYSIETMKGRRIFANYVWGEAQHELLKDYLHNPQDIPLSIKQAVQSLEEEEDEEKEV